MSCRINDQLIRVNNIDVTNAEKKVVMQAVRNGGSVINMVVRRRKSSTTRPIQPVHLHLTGSRGTPQFLFTIINCILFHVF